MTENVFYDYGPVGLLFMLFLAGAVGAARIKLEKHTPRQVLLSFLLSVPITFIVIYAIAPMII